MNWYLFGFFAIVVVLGIVVFIVRAAITVDGAAARLAVAEFGAKVAGLFRKK